MEWEAKVNFVGKRRGMYWLPRSSKRVVSDFRKFVIGYYAL
jgi:hypothetical protein